MNTTTAESPASTASGLGQAEWLDHLRGIGRDHGFFERLGSDHLALFVQESDTLVVSFDRAARVFAQEADGLPLGFEAVQRKEWSLLSILSLEDHWFRSPDLMAFFDSLAASGFFESFVQVIFLGFGPGAGHAACAYSAAAPGAFVLASAPAATLDPERAGFDRRSVRGRRGDISRYGDAPTLTESAREVLVLFDPTQPVSCAHAAQFRGKQVTLAPLRFTGTAPHDLIRTGGLLMPVLRALTHSRLTRARMAAMVRPVRRSDPAYLWRLAGIAQEQGHYDRARRIAHHAAQVTGEARFAKLAAALAD
jgi:hypothetical protein